MNKNSQEPELQDELRRYSTFFIEETRIGVDITIVQEISEEPVVTKVPLAKDYVKGIMNLRGQIITIIDLRRKLGSASLDEDDHQKGVVIVNWKNENIGLMVDKVGDVLESPASKIEPPPSNIQGTSGSFFQGVIYTKNNEILALLNIESVLAEE